MLWFVYLSGIEENDAHKFLSEVLIFCCFCVKTRLPVFAKLHFIFLVFFFGQKRLQDNQKVLFSFLLFHFTTSSSYKDFFSIAVTALYGAWALIARIL